MAARRMTSALLAFALVGATAVPAHAGSLSSAGSAAGGRPTLTPDPATVVETVTPLAGAFGASVVVFLLGLQVRSTRRVAAS